MDPSPDQPSLDPDLLAAAYDEMRALARRRLARVGPQSIQATELVNETWLRLVGRDRDWSDRSELFGIAGRAMRDILVERARRSGALKRGGDWERVNWESAETVATEHPDELLTLGAALSRLTEEAPDQLIEFPGAMPMYSLTEAAMTFTELATLDPGIRESRLGSLGDQDLARLLRALFDADTRARREGFLDLRRG